jgi:diguanylate cyclase (GGDEF)-like protein
MDDLEAFVAAELAKLREDYLSKLPGELAELAQVASALMCSEGERPILEDLHHRLHRLAGSGGTFGLNALSAQSRVQERMVKTWLAGSLDSVEAQAWQTFVEGVSALPGTLQEVETRASAEPRDTKPASTPVQGTHIWLVEDDVPQRQELAGLLQQFGYDVRAFGSLQEAEAGAPQEQPDVLIMDFLFQHGALNAIEAAGRQQAFHALGCPILFISANDDFHSRVSAARLGAAGFFRKPLDLPKLVDRLERIFEERTAVPYRVLIVDDDRTLAEHYRLVLAAAGMDVLVCNDPEGMVEAVATERPELVLMDMNMPGYTGAELATVIRQYDEWVALPIVYLSAETDLDEQIKALGRGADDFLTKPISDAQLVAAVKVRAARSRQLGDLMSKDSLTGLLKHARIKEEVENELQRARRHDRPVSVVMTDIDHFKKVNDTYGHAAGDRVIKALAQLLKQRLRKTDAIGRYGGEEFAIVLPECAPDSAKATMDDIRQRFAALRFIQGEQEFSVTLSAGIASSEAVDSPGQLLVDADEALYQAKHGGRNQVRLHGQPSN